MKIFEVTVTLDPTDGADDSHGLLAEGLTVESVGEMTEEGFSVKFLEFGYPFKFDRLEAINPNGEVNPVEDEKLEKFLCAYRDYLLAKMSKGE